MMTSTLKSAPGTTSPDPVSSFRSILQSNGISEPISEVLIQDSGLQGENLGSITQSVTVKFENSQSLHLFMKTQTTNPVHNVMLQESKVFEKETRFFMEYIPVATEFCKKKGHEALMTIYPKCFYGDDKKILFENLVIGRGYALLNKTEEQDFSAAKLALVSLARHHAISHALIQHCGGAEAFFIKFPSLDHEAFRQPAERNLLEPWIESGITSNINILEKYKVEGGHKSKEILKAASGQAFTRIYEALENSAEESKLLVLNHGDYWNNNMMFRVDATTKELLDHVMIDLQLTRYGNLCLDLHYYLFLSVKPEVRRTCLQELLKIYLDTLNFTSQALGHPMNLSYSELWLHFRKKVDYGVWFSMLSNHGLRFLVAQDINMAELENMGDFAKELERLIDKRLEEHPHEREKFAKSVVQLMKEYSELRLN